MKKFILFMLVNALSGCALEGNRYYPPVSVNNGNGNAAQTMHYGPPASSSAANSMHYGAPAPAYPPVTVTNSDNAADSMHYGDSAN